MTEYGNGSSYTVTMDGPYASGSVDGSNMKMTVIRTAAANWKGAESPYTQVVAVNGIAVNTKIYIELSVEMIQRLSDADKGITFTAENDGGVVTMYAIGDHPGIDLEFQATLIGVVSI